MTVTMIKNSYWVLLAILLTILSDGYQSSILVIMHVNCDWHPAFYHPPQVSILKCIKLKFETEWSVWWPKNEANVDNLIASRIKMKSSP